MKIAGVVTVAEDALAAPFSGERCAGYVATCGLYGHYRQERWCDFFLEDGTGRALVRVGPHVVLKQARPPTQQERHRGRVTAFLRACGMHGEVDLDTLTPYEWTLRPGEVVAVYGDARWERDADPDGSGGHGYRAAPRRLVLEAAEPMALVVIDQPDAPEHAAA